MPWYELPFLAWITPDVAKTARFANPENAVCAPLEMPTPALSGAIDGVASKVAVNVPVSVTPIGLSFQVPVAVAVTQAAFTVKLTVVEWEIPLAPVIVNVYVPVGVELVVVTLSVDVPEVVIEAGLNVPVAPAGNPLTLRFTEPVKPLTAVTLVL